MTVWEQDRLPRRPRHVLPPALHLRPRQRGERPDQRHRRPGPDQRQVVRAHRLRQQVDRRRLDRRAGRQQPEGHGPGQAAPRAARLARQLLRREASRAGKGLRQPPGAAAPASSATRSSNRMGVPIIAGIYGTNPAGGGYQGISPTILLAHKDSQHRRGRRRHRQRHEPQGFLRRGRGRGSSSRPRATSRPSPRAARGSTTTRRAFSGPSTRRKRRSSTPSRSG